MTFDEYKKINFRYMWKVRKLSFVLIPILILIIGSNVFNSFNHPGQEFDLFGLIIFLVFIILFIGFIAFRYNSIFKKNYQNTPILAEGVTVILSEQKIEVHSPLINSEQPWPASFKKAIKIDKWILLSSGAAHFYFLDTENLALPATLADLELLFESKQVKLIK